MSHKAAEHSRIQRKLDAVAAQQQRSHRRRRLLLGSGTAVAVVGIVTAMMLTSRPESSDATRVAPGFTLADTAGQNISLADYRGKNVLLYFSEGAGCQPCITQMKAIEDSKAAFDKADLTVLPIVMNSRDQIMHDMSLYGVKTPFLLDSGTVSKEYGTLGKGMHGGLPGHGFVLIDKRGVQRWYGEFPSMWVPPQQLIRDAEAHLPA